RYVCRWEVAPGRRAASRGRKDADGPVGPGGIPQTFFAFGFHHHQPQKHKPAQPPPPSSHQRPSAESASSASHFRAYLSTTPPPAASAPDTPHPTHAPRRDGPAVGPAAPGMAVPSPSPAPSRHKSP